MATTQKPAAAAAATVNIGAAGSTATAASSGSTLPDNTEVAQLSADRNGLINVAKSRGQLRAVDVADVDLMLTFTDGSHVVIPNGAIDALSGGGWSVHFSDATVTLDELFKQVGKVAAAKAGSLRIHSDQIEATTQKGLSGENSTESTPEANNPDQDIPPAPPAPIASPITPSNTKFTSNGSGAGSGPGEVEDRIVPQVPPPPPVYKAGSKKEVVQEIITDFGAGKNPTFQTSLYTSNEYKVAPSGRSDLPLGAYDSNASSDQQALRAAPAAQATRERIQGSAGNDTINHNTAFSADNSKWVKNLHLDFNNFNSVSTIDLVFSAARIAQIPGFNLTGDGVSRVLVNGVPTNQWTVDPLKNPDIYTKGLNIAIEYNIANGAAVVDFTGDVTVSGMAGKIPIEVTNNLNFTWRDAVTADDFTAFNSAGVPLFVLPNAGVGVEVFAGDGDDTVTSGAGPDILHGEAGSDRLIGGVGNDLLDGGLGADTLDGGAGTDTASYALATQSVTAALDASVVNTGEAAGDVYISVENLQGSAFDDILIGNNEVNRLQGGLGDDTLEGRGGADVLDGEGGNNTASYAHATGGVIANLLTGVGTAGEAQGDTFLNIQNLTGSAFNDVLTGNSENNILDGNGGDDILIGGAGADDLRGGSGNDQVDYSSAPQAVRVSLTTGLSGFTAAGEAFGDTFTSIEGIRGSAFDDTLIGDSQNNTLNGNAGNDIIEGLGGADALDGGAGLDTASYRHAGTAVIASLTQSADFGIAGPIVSQSGDAAGDTFVRVENLEGSAYNDTLIGDAVDNQLSGGAGDDILEGMAGADRLDGSDGNNTASYAHYQGTIGPGAVVFGVTATLTSPGINTGDAVGDQYFNIQNLIGSDFNDNLAGDAGVNQLDGGIGNDVLEGLGGADHLVGGSGSDSASYGQATAAVVASLGAMNAAGINNSGDAAGDTYDSVENLIGSDYDDLLVGDNAANNISGGIGNDTLEGMAGADALLGGAGTDTASYAHAGLGTAGINTTAVGLGVTATLTTNFFGIGSVVTATGDAAGDTYNSIENLNGSDFADTLIGDLNVNAINGGAGDDILEGMGGADVLEGGAGNNTASYEHATLNVVASLSNPGGNTHDAAGDVYSNIQNLRGSTLNDTLTGNAGVNVLSGGTGDDFLEGMDGADVLDGGAGNNTASYANAALFLGSGLTLNLADETTNTGQAAGDHYINIQNVVGTQYNDLIIGDSYDNKLSGGFGDDKLIGSAGADYLDGGANTDTISYETATQGVVSSLTSVFVAGFTVVQSGDAAGDTYASIENMIGSSYGDTLVGDAGINTITGGNGDDVLEGMAGADVLIGGINATTISGSDGSDTASYAHAAAGVVASLTLTSSLTVGPAVNVSGDAAGDTYVSIENLLGSDLNDTLIGDSGVNMLTGGQGDDTLEGLSGADVLTGGFGNDTVSYAHATTGVVSSFTLSFSNGPTVTQAGDAVGDTYVTVENITGSDFADTLIGDASDNILNGGSGDDVLEGMAGGDTLIGGLGIDTASYAHATSAVAVSMSNLSAFGFAAIGHGTGDTFNSIENLLGSNYADQLIGDAGQNTLSGGAGDDVLEGMGNGDVLNGGSGTDTASYEHAVSLGLTLGLTASLFDASANTGDAQGDSYISIENLTGSAYDDTLTGDANANLLIGGSGNDTLSGGPGTDQLNGGDGNDILIDEGTGAGVINGGNGNDNIILTGADAALDIIDGGAGNDTITWSAPAGQYNRVDFDMVAHTFYTRSPTQGTTSNIYNVENVTVTGNNSLYVLLDNNDNVVNTLSNGAANVDYAEYRYANGGITANLSLNEGKTATNAVVNVTGGSGNDILLGIEHFNYGTHYNDILIGDSNNNELRGGMGADYLDGGAGIDRANYNYYESGPVTVSLMSANLNQALGIVFTDVATGDVLTNIEQLYGSGYNDYLYGNAGANSLWAGGGADMLEGMAGADYFDGWNTSTVSYAHAGMVEAGSATTAAGVGVVVSLTTSFSVGPAVNNTGDAAGDTFFNVPNLMGSNYDDQLIGNSGVNTLTGGNGNDILEGMGGADTFSGGAGIDTVSYEHATQAVTVDLSGLLVQNLQVVQTGDAAGDVFFGIENMKGSNYNDVLYGNFADNVIDGGLGNDYLDGSTGIDTASYATATGAVNIDLSTGFVTGAAGSDTLVNFEAVIGSNFADTITGSSADDIIDGGLGGDSLSGGGNSSYGDTVSYQTATGAVTVDLSANKGYGGGNGSAGSGFDTLTGFENIWGSNNNDTLTGDGGANVLEGGLGNDMLNGGSGSDTASYAHALSAVVANIATGATGGDGTDTYVSIENLIGSAFNDTLTGDASANNINGGNGDDLIIGGAGADTLLGGIGIDTVSYATSAAVGATTVSGITNRTGVAVTLNGSGTLGDASGDVLSAFENLIGSAHNDYLIGDGGGNQIDGGLGNDYIDAGAGTDTAYYALSTSAVTVDLTNGVSSGGMGNDSLFGFENVVGSAYNDTLTGDGGANVLEGGAGADTLNGMNGLDTASYINSNAGVTVSLVGGATNTGGHVAGDVLSNIENITGSAFSDTLIGDSGANVLDGGAGDDLLIGGVGADSFLGGAGTDTVSYANATSGVAATFGGAGLTSAGEAVGDTFSGVENFIGSAYNDTLFGDSANNLIIGGNGNDSLRGFDGYDTIDMTLGIDQAWGGNNNDTFLVNISNFNGLSTANQNNFYINGEGRDSGNIENHGGNVVNLMGMVNNTTYDLNAFSARVDYIDTLVMRGDGVNSTVSLTSLAVRQMMDNGNNSQIWIRADTGDSFSLNTVAGETVTTTTNTVNGVAGTDYTVFDATSTMVARIHWQAA